eukprot:7388585-Prymnesium_polylepis.1
MGSTPAMAAWHGTRSQLRRAQREKQREPAAREAVRMEQAARAAQAEKTRREAAATRGLRNPYPQWVRITASHCE